MASAWLRAWSHTRDPIVQVPSGFGLLWMLIFCPVRILFITIGTYFSGCWRSPKLFIVLVIVIGML